MLNCLSREEMEDLNSEGEKTGEVRHHPDSSDVGFQETEVSVAASSSAYAVKWSASGCGDSLHFHGNSFLSYREGQ